MRWPGIPAVPTCLDTPDIPLILFPAGSAAQPPDPIGTGPGVIRQNGLSGSTGSVSLSGCRKTHLFSFNATTGVMIRP
ncbi:MAG: hypothetical protein A4E35_01245 [Methanoregula sp. PtaU1.Bin051]|nr:MAG: hypothetical protein A4E35_01245 [Methanoregula sp. PtaU1.Bin051]